MGVGLTNGIGKPSPSVAATKPPDIDPPLPDVLRELVMTLKPGD